MRASTKKVTPKKRGRPATGRDPARTFRLSDQLIESVDAWAAAKDDQPSRSEAIRRLVELGLTVPSKARKQPPSSGADRAKDLATSAVERIIDPSVPREERVKRRRQLTRGPIEFREERVDQPKAKK
jgi:Arc/MetJ-type ribon-helix-helix transcriptional regulator